MFRGNWRYLSHAKPADLLDLCAPARHVTLVGACFAAVAVLLRLLLGRLVPELGIRVVLFQEIAW